jgi:hypothetical protein
LPVGKSLGNVEHALHHEHGAGADRVAFCIGHLDPTGDLAINVENESEIRHDDDDANETFSGGDCWRCDESSKDDAGLTDWNCENQQKRAWLFAKEEDSHSDFVHEGRETIVPNQKRTSVNSKFLLLLLWKLVLLWWWYLKLLMLSWSC